jgi:hypothetical protein
MGILMGDISLNEINCQYWYLILKIWQSELQVSLTMKLKEFLIPLLEYPYPMPDCEYHFRGHYLL